MPDIKEPTAEDLRAKNLFSEFGLTESESAMFELFEGREAALNLDSAVTPEQAEAKLTGLGYKPSDWESMVANRMGSHETRALAIVALGTTARLDYIIASNLKTIDFLEGVEMINETGGRPILRQTGTHTAALTALIESRGLQHMTGGE